jgi:hypothetical protein
MKSELHTLGVFGSVLLTAACASSGATATSEMRAEGRPGSAASEQLIPRRSCTPTNTSVAPADGLLADFSAKPGGGVPAKVQSSVPPNAVPSPTLTSTTDGGMLKIEVQAMPGAKPQVLSTELLFDGCVDASGFSGVEFKLSGSLSGCSLTYASVDPEHQYYRPGGPYPPQKRIAAAELTAEPRTITASFGNPESPGNPATPTDAGRLAFLQWLVIVPVGSDGGEAVPPCTGTLHVDDVKLYR